MSILRLLTSEGLINRMSSLFVAEILNRNQEKNVKGLDRENLSVRLSDDNITFPSMLSLSSAQFNSSNIIKSSNE